MRNEKIKQYKWVKTNDPKKVVNVWVHNEIEVKQDGCVSSVKSYINISGYNTFPFFGSTEFKTTYKVFSEWMKENGYEPMIKMSNVFMDKTIYF